MSVPTTVDALQRVHASITGVKSAPLIIPGSVNSADLPLVLVRPAEAEWSAQAIGLPRQDRWYEVFCLVAPVASGRSPDSGVRAALPLLQAFGEGYMSDVTISGAVDHVREIRDGGIESLTFAGVSYHGFTFRLLVVEK